MSKEKKQTAVDWLTKKLWDEFGMAFSNNILEQAKAIEKQQIVDAHTFAHSQLGEGKFMPSEQEQQELAEQYYSQKYNQKP